MGVAELFSSETVMSSASLGQHVELLRILVGKKFQRNVEKL